MPALATTSPFPCVSQLLSRLRGDPMLAEGHKEIFVARAPGRLDLMGGVTDISGGLVCQYPLASSIAVALQRRDDRQLVIRNFNDDDAAAEKTVTLSLDDFYGTAALLSDHAMHNLFAGGRSWAAFIAGVFPVLARHKKITRSSHGANIACYTDQPAGAVSAAAAACAMLWAMTAAYHLILDPMEIAVLAQRIENQVAAVPSGIAPHAAAVLSRPQQMMLLECQPHELKGFMPVPRGLTIAGVYTGGPAVDAGAHRDARVSVFMAQAMAGRMLRDLGFKKDPTRGYLANVSAESFQKYFSAILPERTTGQEFVIGENTITDRTTPIEPEHIYAPRAAAEHHIMEVARTRRFVEQMREAENAPAAMPEHALAAGQTMLESHASAERLGLAATPAARLVTAIAARKNAGLFGARLSGSSGRTAAVLMADSAQSYAALAEAMKEFANTSGLSPVLLTGSAPGASEAVPLRISASDLMP